MSKCSGVGGIGKQEKTVPSLCMRPCESLVSVKENACSKKNHLRKV